MEVHRQKLKKNWAEDLALSKDRRPAEKVDFNKTLALLPLKMLILLPSKDFIPLPHDKNLPEMIKLLPVLVSKENCSGTSLAVVSR